MRLSGLRQDVLYGMGERNDLRELVYIEVIM